MTHRHFSTASSLTRASLCLSTNACWTRSWSSKTLSPLTRSSTTHSYGSGKWYLLCKKPGISYSFGSDRHSTWHCGACDWRATMCTLNWIIYMVPFLWLCSEFLCHDPYWRTVTECFSSRFVDWTNSGVYFDGHNGECRDDMKEFLLENYK